MNELNKKGLLKKVYGGAFPIIAKPANIFDITIVNKDKKNKIANKALRLLADGPKMSFAPDRGKILEISRANREIDFSHVK